MMEQHLFKESEAARFMESSTRTMQYWRTICRDRIYQAEWDQDSV